MAAVLWKEQDTPERRAVFEMLAQNLPLNYYIVSREENLICEMTQKLLLSSPQAVPLAAPKGSVGFHKPEPPSGAHPASSATGTPAVPGASLPPDRKDGP